MARTEDQQPSLGRDFLPMLSTANTSLHCTLGVEAIISAVLAMLVPLRDRAGRRPKHSELPPAPPQPPTRSAEQ